VKIRNKRRPTRWLWPVIPAVLVVWILSNVADRRCPPYSNPLPPHPEQCLPTMAASLTGASPWLVAGSWMLIGLLVYSLIIIVSTAPRHRMA